jgi:hypothetical protein
LALAPLALLTPAAPADMHDHGPNHILNGDFENDLAGWNAFDFVEGDDGKPANATTNDAVLKRVTPADGEDMTADGSKGALRVTIEGFEGRNTTKADGAEADMMPPLDKGQVYRVAFDARSISGARNLKVTRKWGGGKTEKGGVELTSDWQRYELDVSLAYRSPSLMFSLTDRDLKPRGNQRLGEGVFLIDNVTVTHVGEVDAE